MDLSLSADALENKTEMYVNHNTDVLCEAHTNSQSCSYAWYDDRSQQVSSAQNMTARRLGSHQCKAKCRMRNEDCEIVAKQIYVTPPTPPTPPSTPPTPSTPPSTSCRSTIMPQYTYSNTYRTQQKQSKLLPQLLIRNDDLYIVILSLKI